MNCTDVPSILRAEPARDACKRLADAKPDCVCETQSVAPDYSPGPVLAHERLARFVPELDYDGETNTVKPSLFAHAGTCGMSTTRLLHANDDQLWEQLGSKPYVGFVTADCHTIRRVEFEGRQCFGVYDTSLRENTAHADVCQALFPKPRSVQSDLRRRLQVQFTANPTRIGFDGSASPPPRFPP